MRAQGSRIGTWGIKVGIQGIRVGMQGMGKRMWEC